MSDEDTPAVEIPEDGVVTTQMHLVGYLMPDGSSRWAVRVTGADTNTGTIVGMLEMAKHRFLRRNEEENADDDD